MKVPQCLNPDLLVLSRDDAIRSWNIEMDQLPRTLTSLFLILVLGTWVIDAGNNITMIIIIKHADLKTCPHGNVILPKNKCV